MNLEIKIFVTSMLLQELLDETEGDSRFKHKTRFHINGLQKELDKVLTEPIDTDELSLYLSRASQALEDTLNEINDSNPV